MRPSCQRGRTLQDQAIRDNELRAEALGAPTFDFVSSTFASVVAAVVGGCHLMWVRYVNPESALGVPVALSKVRKELIATAVSADNGCSHCTKLLGGFLGKLTTDLGLVRALMRDPATAPLHGADRALVTYAPQAHADTAQGPRKRCGRAAGCRPLGYGDLRGGLRHRRLQLHHPRGRGSGHRAGGLTRPCAGRHRPATLCRGLPRRDGGTGRREGLKNL